MTSTVRSSHHHGPSIRRLLTILLATMAFLVASLFILTSLQLQGSNHEAKVENRRTQSLLIANSMQESSDDLTLMVRLYVSTGQPQYRDYYNEILAIRAGTAPRPLNYTSTFWDQVLAHGTGFVTYGPPESLTDQMRAAGFTPLEFDALNSALRSSNQLATLELLVMDQVALRIAKGVNATYSTDVEPDYRLLVDANYLAQKGVIMGAVSDFINLVDQTTAADVARVQRDNHRLFVAQLAVLAAIVLVGAAAWIVTKRQALRPLDHLIDATRRIAGGDYRERAAVKGVSELERVADAFNAMASAVEADVERRVHAEHVATEARRAAEDASRAKSSFLAAMSHEIRTPMIGVTGMLEVLAQSDLSRPQRHMVGTAQSSAAALLQIIGDTLDFSKIEAGKLEIASSTFSVRGVVGSAVATFIHTASAKGLQLTAHCDDQLEAAHIGDPLRIRQILSNFLSNSVKFTDVGGIELTVRVVGPVGADASKTSAQSLEFMVVDTGIGLTREQQQNLFGEFAQAEPSTTHRFGGTGLGLAICKKLALLMGGDVTMDSSIGHGTTLRLNLELPIGDESQVLPEATFTSTRFAASRPTPTRVEAIREGSLVLAAEDHSVNRAVLLHQLETVGICADTADDGQQALELFISGDYSMVITDVHMPRLDGYGLAEAIRRFEAETGRRRTPIMALTANVMQGEPQRCLDAGMDDFAAKPATIPLLAAKVHEWLPHLEFPRLVADEEVQPVGVSGSHGDCFDHSVLDELTGGDASLAALILRDFVDSTTVDMGRLDEALQAEDAEEVRHQAHRIKGVGSAVGATEVATVAARLESAAPDGDAADLRAMREELSAAFDKVMAELKSDPT